MVRLNAFTLNPRRLACGATRSKGCQVVLVNPSMEGDNLEESSVTWLNQIKAKGIAGDVVLNRLATTGEWTGVETSRKLRSGLWHRGRVKQVAVECEGSGYQDDAIPGR